jgi:hypothetical protein
MKGKYSAYAMQDLLRMMEGEEIANEDLDSPLQQRLFNKWRDGHYLDMLVKFLQSDRTHERYSGAYYLGEAVPRGESIRETVTAFADDPLPYCRKAFVTYMLNTGLYDDAIAAGLVRCLLDSDFYVRLEAINWAVYTTDERFAHFSELVKSGAEAAKYEGWSDAFLKRSARGLAIAERLRSGESMEKIRQGMPEEDSITFDYLQSFEGRFKRYSERRRAPARGHHQTIAGYDDYEIGALGEIYDNTGRMKSDMPLDDVPAHITDEQLAESIGRLKESVRQRGFDHQLLSR